MSLLWEFCEMYASDLALPGVGREVENISMYNMYGLPSNSLASSRIKRICWNPWPRNLIVTWKRLLGLRSSSTFTAERSYLPVIMMKHKSEHFRLTVDPSNGRSSLYVIEGH